MDIQIRLAYLTITTFIGFSTIRQKIDEIVMNLKFMEENLKNICYVYANDDGEFYEKVLMMIMNIIKIKLIMQRNIKQLRVK